MLQKFKRLPCLEQRKFLKSLNCIPNPSLFSLCYIFAVICCNHILYFQMQCFANFKTVHHFRFCVKPLPKCSNILDKMALCVPEFLSILCFWRINIYTLVFVFDCSFNILGRIFQMQRIVYSLRIKLCYLYNSLSFNVFISSHYLSIHIFKELIS